MSNLYSLAIVFVSLVLVFQEIKADDHDASIPSGGGSKGNNYSDLPEKFETPLKGLFQVSATTDDEKKPKTNEEKFREVADRLEKVFGQKVAVSRVRDFNGVPTFEIDGGTDKASAERIIDDLIEVRTKAGLTKKELPLGSTKDGKITIYGGAILNYGPGKSNVIDSTFEKIENEDITKAFKKCFPRSGR